MIAVVLLLSLSQHALAQDAPAPLPVFNLNPLHLVFLQPPAQGPVSASRVGVALNYATVLVTEARGADSAVLDMEVARFGLYLAKTSGSGTEWWAELPYLWFGGGAFDDVLINYHDALHLSDGGRSDRPRDTFEYSVRRGEDVYSPDPPRSGGLGDVVVGAKRPIALLTRGTTGVAWRLFTKLPTGSPGHGFGSGRVDLGGGFVASWTGQKLWLSGNLDGLYFGGTPDSALRLGTPLAVSALAEAGWRLAFLGTVSAGLRYLSSPYDTGLPALDRDVLMLEMGFQRDLSPSLRFHLGFTEDLAVESSPDFCVVLGLAWAPSP